MEWIKKNWIMMIVIVIAAIPLINTFSSIRINFDNGLSISGYISEEIKARFMHSGRVLSPWGMPLHLTGEWAIRMIVITLSCTPLSILTRNKKILRYKKVFGIFTFVYTLLHLVFYLADHNFFEIFSQMNLIIALISTIIIIPLGITSNKFSMRFLREGWIKLQRFAYAAAITAILHIALLGKGSWLLYSIILTIGFILRVPAIKIYFAKRKNPVAVSAATSIS